MPERSDHWDGIMTDGQGQPIVQGANDPFPGYYVSCTSLSDRSKAASDPTRYVDATKIPYVVLPRWVADQGGARLGDFVYVVKLANGKSSYAIFADIGTLGEGSVALANNTTASGRTRGKADAVAAFSIWFFPAQEIASRAPWKKFRARRKSL